MLVKQCRVPVDHNASLPHGGQPQTRGIRAVCPRCKAAKDKTNGPRHTGKPPQHCHDWGRPGVPCSAPYGLVADRRALLDRWRLAPIALRGRGRAVGVTLPGRLGVLVPCCAALSAPLPVPPVSWTPQVRRQRLAVDAEARARLVQQKANTQWRGSVMDATRRQGMAWPVGARRRRRAQRLGAERPKATGSPRCFPPSRPSCPMGACLRRRPARSAHWRGNRSSRALQQHATPARLASRARSVCRFPSGLRSIAVR